MGSDKTEWCACTPSSFGRVGLFLTPGTAAHRAPLSMEFSHSRGLPCPPPRGSSPPKDRTQVSCVAADSLLLSHWEAQVLRRAGRGGGKPWKRVIDPVLGSEGML